MAEGEPADHHAERDAILQDVLKVFCEKGDMNAVREAGRNIFELQAAGEARHKQMLEDIKGAAWTATRQLHANLGMEEGKGCWRSAVAISHRRA